MVMSCQQCCNVYMPGYIYVPVKAMVSPLLTMVWDELAGVLYPATGP